ncbi:MAG: hypothetical protein ACYCZN_10215 [Candidatus Dormibacteria bacterium]
MSRADVITLGLVARDLRRLRKLSERAPTDDELRGLSGTFRAMVVDTQPGLQRAWRAASMPGRLIVGAPDLQVVLKGLDLEKVEFAGAGGAELQGTRIAQSLFYRAALSPSEIESRSATRSPSFRSYSLARFLDSIGIVVRGRAVTRREMVKFFAIALGGAHYDMDTGRYGHLIAALHGNVVLAGRSALFFEYLSLVQQVLLSPSADELLRRMDDLGEQQTHLG